MRPNSLEWERVKCRPFYARNLIHEVSEFIFPDHAKYFMLNYCIHLQRHTSGLMPPHGRSSVERDCICFGTWKSDVWFESHQQTYFHSIFGWSSLPLGWFIMLFMVAFGWHSFFTKPHVDPVGSIDTPHLVNHHKKEENTLCYQTI